MSRKPSCNSCGMIDAKDDLTRAQRLTRGPSTQEREDMADEDLTPVPSEDPALQRFADIPFRGIRYDGDGNVVEPPPGPARDRAVALLAAWKRYEDNGDRRPLVELGVFNPDPPPPFGDPEENG